MLASRAAQALSFQSKSDSCVGVDSSGNGFPKRNVPGNPVKLCASMTEDFNAASIAGGSQAGSDLRDALERLVSGRLAQVSQSDTATDAAAAYPRSFPVCTDAPENCPEPGEWAQLLGEVKQPGELLAGNALLAHAAACGRCAQRLHRFSGWPAGGERSHCSRRHASGWPRPWPARRISPPTKPPCAFTWVWALAWPLRC